MTNFFFPFSEFESKLEAGDKLDMELFSSLNTTKTEVQALKTVDQGKVGETRCVSTHGFEWVCENLLVLELEARLNAVDLEGQSVRVEQLQLQSKGKKQTGIEEWREHGETDQAGEIMSFDYVELQARLAELGSRFEGLDSDVRELHNVDQGELTKTWQKSTQSSWLWKWFPLRCCAELEARLNTTEAEAEVQGTLVVRLQTKISGEYRTGTKWSCEEPKTGVNIDFPLSDFESRLETSEVLEKELEARLGKAEEEVQTLKMADGGKLTSCSGPEFYAGPEQLNLPRPSSNDLRRISMGLKRKEIMTTFYCHHTNSPNS